MLWGKKLLGLSLLWWHYFWGTLVSTVLIFVCSSEMGRIRGSGKGKKQLCSFEYGKTVSNKQSPIRAQFMVPLNIIFEKAGLFQHLTLWWKMYNRWTHNGIYKKKSIIANLYTVPSICLVHWPMYNILHRNIDSYILHNTMRGRDNYYLSFTIEETEAQRLRNLLKMTP